MIINQIAKGGSSGNPVAEENDVIFIDYDGTIRYSYSSVEFAQLTELPPNPMHEGLTAQGWNWTLSDAKAFVQKYKKHCIGQNYNTFDGKTRIYIHLTNEWHSPYLGLAVIGTCVISWGDGSPDTTITGNSGSTIISTPAPYSTGGDYVITLTITGEVDIVSDSSNTTKLLWANDGIASTSNKRYQCAITKIELGDNIYVRNYGLRHARNLKTITIPRGSNPFNTNQAFDMCVSLKGLCLPSNYAYINDGYCRSTGDMTHLSYCKTTTVGSNCFVSTGISRFVIPDSNTVIPNGVLNNARVREVVIPENISSIGTRAFAYCSLNDIYFYPETPPAISASNAFLDVNQYALTVHVPKGKLSAYSTATNYPDPTIATYVEMK